MHPMRNLPATVLTQILQHVPLQQRLRDCALVCQAWAAAAAMATTSISSSDLTAEQLPLLQAWIEQHGQGLVSLELGVSQRQAELQLPCPKQVQLTRLHLTACEPCLQLPISSSSCMVGPTPDMGPCASTTVYAGQGVLLPMPRLQSVKIAACVLSSPTTLLQLRSLMSITELRLVDIKLNPSCGQPLQQVSDTLSQVLQHLRNLRCLELTSVEISEAALSPCSDMQHLQDLSVSRPMPAEHDQLPSEAQLLAHMPSSLTRLRLVFCGDPDQPRLPRDLVQLAHLQQLHVSYSYVDPAALQLMQQLRELCLDECELLPRGNPAEAAAALFAAVGRMSALEELSFIGSIQDCSTLPPHIFTALTAATGLQSVDITLEHDMLPLGAVEYMFPQGKQLPRLSFLHLYSYSSGGQPMDDYCMTATDLRRVVAACPALQNLGVPHALGPDAVPALLDLPESCGTLYIGGGAVDDAAAAVVAQLTQLRLLDVLESPSLSDAGLEQLTALRGLTELHLYIYNSSLSRELVDVVHKHGDGTYSDLHLCTGTQVREPCRLGQAILQFNLLVNLLVFSKKISCIRSAF